MDFFPNLFGFQESGYLMTQEKLLQTAIFREMPLEHYFREQCDFHLPGRRMVTAGIFSMPSIMELRESADGLLNKNECNIRVQNMKGESRSLHSNNTKINKTGAPVVIQAASQFNLLEFSSASECPESGISGYVFDHTQGPACAVACAAGTAYRKYLVPVPFPKRCKQEPGRRGQTKQHQLNGLADVEEYLLRETSLGECPWTVTNGYIESSRAKLAELNQLLSSPGNDLYDHMISRIRIGVQEDTAVTDDRSLNTKVTQTYNSAISIGYSSLPVALWKPVAQVVLDATYEATLLVGVLQSRSGAPPPTVFLTKVGGGVFGNDGAWIRQAMARAIRKVETYGVPLDIRIVHYGSIEQEYKELER